MLQVTSWDKGHIQPPVDLATDPLVPADMNAHYMHGTKQTA